MNTTDVQRNDTSDPSATTVDLKFEAVVIPVSDVDRAMEFYGSLGWRRDADFGFDNGFRVVQFTPPGSGCSVQFGTNITSAAPGSAQGLYLVVSDIEAARDELATRGVEVSEVFHAGTPGAQFQPDGTSGRVTGPARRSLQLRLLRHVQRPGRERLAAPGDHDPSARAGRRRRDVFRLRQRAGQRAPAARRPPTASTRSAPGRPTRTGRTGTPRTWSRSRPGRSCRRERLRRDRVSAVGRPASTALRRWLRAGCASRSSSGSWSAASARTGRVSRRSRCCARVRRCRARARPARRAQVDVAGRAGLAGLHGVELFRRRPAALAGRPGHRPAARHGSAGRHRRGRRRGRPPHRGAHRRGDRLRPDRATDPGPA